jgi:hypothetical protein
MEITDLHVLAQMASGSPNEEDAFVIRDKNDKEILRIHNLSELVDALTNLSIEEFLPSICRETEGEFECDIALWVHYVLGDATLSAKMFLLVNEYANNPEKLKLEMFNLCFNRYLNYQELMDFSYETTIFENDSQPSDL